MGAGMTLASAPFAAYGFAFGDGGSNQFLFGGPTDGSNPAPGVQVLQVDGLESFPALRVQDINRGYMDGSFTGRDFLDARTITFTLQIMSDANHTMQYYLGELQKYLMMQRTGTNVLQVYFPGTEAPYVRGVRRLYGRVRRRAITMDPNYVYGRAVATLEFYCPDPRVYNDQLSSYPISSIAAFGRTYNRTYPLQYVTVLPGSTGSVTVTNQGNYETWPQLTIAGSSCAAPVITNLTTGDVLSFPNLVLGSADTLVIDSDLRTVTINGVPSRNTMTAVSRWFPLPPQVSQTLGVTCSAGTASCTVTYRDAYI